MRGCRLLAFLLLLASAAEAADRYQLVRIHAKGSQRYSEAEIIRATGLSAGSQIAVDELNDAAQRLNSTGAFSTVRYGYHASANPVGIDADFEVTDAEQGRYRQLYF